MCSAFARLLCIGLRNEADDNGIFEWKPVTIKMRLLPADAVDVVSLLAELEEHRHVMRFEAGGKSYGAIRNFCRYQRPKKPNTVHPVTEQVREFVGQTAADDGESSEPVPNRFPTGGENPPQRKEEGGKREEVLDSSLRSESDAREVGPPLDAEFADWYATYPHKIGRAAALKAFKTARRKADLPVLQAGVARYIREKPPDRPWCNPATWLNQERWNDQPAVQASGGGHGAGDSGKVGRRTAAIDAILGARHGEAREPDFLDAGYVVVSRQH